MQASFTSGPARRCAGRGHTRIALDVLHQQETTEQHAPGTYGAANITLFPEVSSCLCICLCICCNPPSGSRRALIALPHTKPYLSDMAYSANGMFTGIFTVVLFWRVIYSFLILIFLRLPSLPKLDARLFVIYTTLSRRAGSSRCCRQQNTSNVAKAFDIPATLPIRDEDPKEIDPRRISMPELR